MTDQTDDQYDVVTNVHGHYSIWPSGKELPLGWHQSGFSGSREDSLHYISEVWIDAHPRALLDAMKAGRE
ncbi:MbtH family NRPS accessory protein [Undibacterium sp. CY18W]|uniref:MbtH family NRPS accessory protein n=1 Tax=Undibacterium hunanense TaxID=2762292 RepID=A0ABR6ZJ00_9BURK|nr:MbtH family NRPS accessory protein [Undibacterium hunanense]MBC3915872.1 MbtH family NRPS accessory protein [Undibacterium hunanense]